MYTKIKVKVFDDKNACSEENFKNIQILNVVESLNLEKAEIHIDDIFKTPVLSTKPLHTDLDQSSLDFLVKSVSSNYEPGELFKVYASNSDIKHVFEFLLFPKKSLKLIYSK